MLVDQLGETVEIRRAALGAQRGPGGEGAYGGADRGVGGCGVTTTDLGEQRAVDRRAILECRRARHALAVDVVLGRDRVAVDLDAVAHALPRRSVIVSRSSTEYANVKR